MSGHSHAKTIKHQKNLTDQKRGRMFSKMANVISVAVKEGGANPATNNKLKVVMEQAKEFNMPKDNIERAIKQATGGGEGANLFEMVFEAYGPGGIAIIIEAISDNKNRALGEVKQALSQHGGKLVGEGGVRWLFERRVRAEEPGSLEWVAKQDVEVSGPERESCQKLFDALDETDSVQEIYSNLK